MAYADSLTSISDDVFLYTDEAAHPGYLAGFRKTLETVAALPCDILLTPHPEQARSGSAWAPRPTQPLADAEGCRNYAARGGKGLDERVAKERARAAASTAETYSIYASGQKSAPWSVTQDGALQDGTSIEIAFEINENGRGPRSQEKIVLGEKGLPVAWTIDGSGLGGGSDREEFVYRDGESVWTSAAEKGKSPGPPRLYVPATASPWAKVLFARYAAAQPEGRAEILPSGSLQVRRREPLTVGAGAASRQVDLVVLDGLEMASDFLLLDQDGRLFADLGSFLVLRDGYEAELARLTELGDQLTRDLQSEMHERLAHRPNVPWRGHNVR